MKVLDGNMKLLMKFVGYMSAFQWFEVLAVIGFTIYFVVVDKESSTLYLVINSISAICGIFCVVLCAAGKKSQYYWGFINIAAYIVIATMSKYYGQVALNALYYLPTQFIGLYLWKKHMNEDLDAVKTKKMKVTQIIIYLIAIVGGVFIFRYILELLNGNQTWLDSILLMISLVANALMVLRYKEQWALWIIVDIITVVLWVLAGDWIQVSMWSVYLLNAFYGFYKWSKMSKINAENE